MPGTTRSIPNIRRFDAGDEAGLLRVFFSAVHDIASKDYTVEQIKAWAPADLDQAAWARHMRALKPFVAEMDHQIVGYADVQAKGYIDHFFVSGLYPRQGIGSLLMDRIHERATHLHLTELTADVSRSAQLFFAYHGFVIVAQQSPILRGVAIPNARMRKVLSDAQD